MKIQEYDGEVVDIFGIYWVNDKTLVLGFPKGYGGLRPYNLNNVTVIDPALSGSLMFFENGVYHAALINEYLLDNILERDETAYKRFLEILKAEGRIEPDFS